MKKSIIIGSILFIFFALALGVAFYYYKAVLVDSDKDSAKKATTQTTAKTDTDCPSLVPDGNLTEGNAPFQPTIRVKVPGDVSGQVCQWSIDNTLSHTSFVVKGECIFGNRALMTKGKHSIKYKNTQNSCTKSIDIVVK